MAYGKFSALKSVCLKEWIKLRLLVWVPFLVLLAVLCNVWFSYRGFRASHGAAALWVDLVYKQTILFGKMQWALIGGGIWFACLQFLPECSGRRLRLLFHLPVSHRFPLYSMVLIGLALQLSLSALGYGGLLLVFSRMGFPPELALPMAGTVIPWGLAGMTAYCAAAAVIAEPSLPRKLAFALIGYAWAVMLGTTLGFSSMRGSLWLYLLACLPWPPAFESAALRVKEGRS